MPIHDWTRVDPGVFHDFHTTWITDLLRTLIGSLPPTCYSMVEQAESGRSPDVLIEALDWSRPDAARYAKRARALVVRRTKDDQIITVVEIVSPGNKAGRDPSRAFVERAVGRLRSGIHLVLVDLLPAGPADPGGIHDALWMQLTEEGPTHPMGKPLTVASYVGGNEIKAYVEPLAVGDALPVMPLFLEPDVYVNLLLEPAYMSAYATIPPRWREVLESP